MKLSELPGKVAAKLVTPLVGVWIEILYEIKQDFRQDPSLPLWECGLKSKDISSSIHKIVSLPLWECGLKSGLKVKDDTILDVTPLVGVWIEIPFLPRPFKRL